MSIKEGKKPVSSKAAPAPSFYSYDDLFGNLQRIPDDILKELDEQGLVGRWINAKKVYENQGYHEKGWRVYKRKSAAATPIEFKTGSDPDGIIRRGDMLLGVKTKEEASKHKTYLAQAAERQKGAAAKSAQELRKMMGGQGKVFEGYEENE
jgi:hypothetical protein